MSAHLRRNATILKTISKATPSARKKLLKLADESLIRSICECCENTIKGRVKLSPIQKKRLLRHKRILRRLAKSGDNWKQKKKFIVQSGGFIIPLLAPVLGTLGSILANFISKKI
jgi:CHAD domain-containing protein